MYYFDILIDRPDDKDVERRKNNYPDEFASPTLSAYVAESKHCNDHTSKQSRSASIGKSPLHLQYIRGYR